MATVLLTLVCAIDSAEVSMFEYQTIWLPGSAQDGVLIPLPVAPDGSPQLIRTSIRFVSACISHRWTQWQHRSFLPSHWKSQELQPETVAGMSGAPFASNP